MRVRVPSSLLVKIVARKGVIFINQYEERDGFYIGYTNRKGNIFLFDKEDFDLISKFHWILDSERNVITKVDNRRKSMHSLILGDGIYIHKNGNNADNRKSNLIVARGSHNYGKIITNGYVAVYFPEHKRAFENGCVYEHILVAEEKLGRELLKDECVHHIDHNRKNNSSDNLMVFATKNDHALYHAGAQAVKQENGSYTCKIKSTFSCSDNNATKDNQNDIVDLNLITEANLYDMCPVCNVNKKARSSKMCIKCYKSERRKDIPKKEILAEEIYKNSFEKLGRKYGVSGNAVRKWCKGYDLPYRKKDIVS